MTAPALTGTAAVRYIVADVLADLDGLGITPKGVTVNLYDDGTVSELQVWFVDVADFDDYGDRLGLPAFHHLNGGPGSSLLWRGNTWGDAPVRVGGVPLRARLVCSVDRGAGYGVDL